jgi:hypothetical protein
MLVNPERATRNIGHPAPRIVRIRPPCQFSRQDAALAVVAGRGDNAPGDRRNEP